MDTNVVEIFAQMVTLFAILAVGYIARKLHLMSEELNRSLSKLILNVALPAMVIGAVLTADALPTHAELGVTLISSLSSLVIALACAYVVTFALRIGQGHRGVYRFLIAFCNCGFMGFPVVSAIFGSDALIYATVYLLPYNLVFFTMGTIFVLQDNSESARAEITWKLFATPVVIACVMAIVLVIFGIHNVPIIGDAAETLGNLTTPGALLIVGSTLAGMPVKSMLGSVRLILASVARLAVVPLCTWALLHFFIDGQLLGVIVVLSGMPGATNGTMLCYQYGGDSKTMAQGISITTVLSVVSIPLLVAFL